MAEAFVAAIREEAEAQKLASSEQFSHYGTLVEAAASLESLRPIAESENEGPPAGGGRNARVDLPRAAAPQ